MRVARTAALSLAVTLALTGKLGAQPDSARQRTAPPPRPRVVLVTNVGPAAGLDWRGNSLRGLVGDWGLMIRTGPRAALGASYSASLDERGRFEGGPALRYRRWLGARHALDVAVGWGGEPRTDKLTKNYSLFGLVEFEVKPWLGIVAQGSRRGTLLGVQLRSGPGLIASAIGAVAGALGAVRAGL